MVAWLAPFFGQIGGAPGPYPAIVTANHGRGRIALYTFDLAESTVLFHQGLREHASTGTTPDYDADSTYRAGDMFVGYLDERLKNVPQADVHQIHAE